MTTSRFVKEGIFNCVILLPVGTIDQGLKKAAVRLSKHLTWLALLAFALGCCFRMSLPIQTPGNCHLFGYYILLFLSVCAHELGHFVASVAADCHVTDVGLLALGLVPMGAYVRYCDNEDASIGEHIQLALAGVEMNLLMAGLYLLLSLIGGFFTTTLICAANASVLLALINVLPVQGLDGDKALGSLWEVSSIQEVAKIVIRSKKIRREFMASRFFKLGYLVFFLFLRVFHWGVVALLAAEWLWIGISAILQLIQG